MIELPIIYLTDSRDNTVGVVHMSVNTGYTETVYVALNGFLSAFYCPQHLCISGPNHNIRSQRRTV